MRRLVVALVATLAAVAAVVGVPAPANAEVIAYADEAGDTMEPGPDFTKVALRNRSHAVVAVMRFRRDRRGEIIVGVRARGRSVLARMVSIHRRQGADHTYLLVGEDERSCRGVRSRWDQKDAKLRLRMPSRCFLDGDFGAVRAWFLTEGHHGGGDVDYAPERPGGVHVTGWVARG